LYLRLIFWDSVFQKAFTYISGIGKVFVLLTDFDQHVQVADVIRCQTKVRLETERHTIAETSAGIGAVGLVVIEVGSHAHDITGFGRADHAKVAHMSVGVG